MYSYKGLYTEQEYSSSPVISIQAGRSVMEGSRRWAGDTDSESILFKRIRVSHWDEAELAEYISTMIRMQPLKAEQTWQLVLRRFSMPATTVIA